MKTRHKTCLVRIQGHGGFRARHKLAADYKGDMSGQTISSPLLFFSLQSLFLRQ
jgi:hypothetical protein